MTEMLESKQHARQVYEILHNAWWQAYRATNGGRTGDVESFRLIESALKRIKAEAVERFGNNEAHPECKYCREVSVFGGPRHEASARCESGKRSHCSCDLCF